MKQSWRADAAFAAADPAFIKYRSMLGKPVVDVLELQAVPGWDAYTIRRIGPVKTGSGAGFENPPGRAVFGMATIISCFGYPGCWNNQRDTGPIRAPSIITGVRRKIFSAIPVRPTEPTSIWLGG